MPKLHIFLLSLILFLFFMVVFESFIGLIIGYMVTLIDGFWNSRPYFWYLFIIYSVLPIRDFLVASLLGYLYYCRGLKDQKRDFEKFTRSAHEQMIKTIAITETG